MKLSTVNPGDDVVLTDNGHRYRVLAHRTEVDRDWRVPQDVLDALGVRTAVGKGGARPAARPLGRGYARRGTLAVEVDWVTGNPDATWTGFALFRSGHDAVPLEEFNLMWADGVYRQIKRSLREQRRTGAQSRWTLTTAVEPLVSVRDEIVSRLRYGVHDPDARVVDAVETGDGVEFVDVTGARVDVDDLRYLICDPAGFHLGVIREVGEREATKGVRSRTRDALRSVARSVDADPRCVQVGTDRVTVPHAVLEALVLGDEFGVAAVLDGIAELRDVLADATHPD